MFYFILNFLLEILPLAVIRSPWYFSLPILLILTFVPGFISTAICYRRGLDASFEPLLRGCIGDFMLYPVYLLSAGITIALLFDCTPNTLGIVLIIFFIIAFIFKTISFIQSISIYRDITKHL